MLTSEYMEYIINYIIIRIIMYLEKGMEKRKRKLLTCILFALFVFLFVMLYKAPFRLDDLTWGGRIGMERLHNRFADYNGRYAGNMVVIILTRLPGILRVLLEIVCIALLFQTAYMMFEKDMLSSVVFLCLFFVMPLPIFTQTITWISGFSNYLISTLLTSIVLLVDLRMLKDGKELPACWSVLFLLLVFAGQLFVETATLYVVALSAFIVIIQFIRYKKASRTQIFQLAAALAGAIWMFSNGSYVSAFLHDGGTYKSISVGGGLPAMLHRMMVTYRDSVAQKWFGANLPLNLFLSILLTVFCLRSIHHRKWTGQGLALIGSGFFAAFMYDLVDGDHTDKHSGTVLSIVSVLFVLYILAVILFLVQGWYETVKLLILVGSLGVFMLPLTLVEPINDRCMLNTYVLWGVITAEFLRILPGREMIRTRYDNVVILLCVFSTFYLLHAIDGQALSWKIEQMRMDAIEEWRQTKAAELKIPEIPDAGLYCYGANLSGNYWKNNYKEYYGIENSVKLEFIGYKDYIEESGRDR